MPKRWTKWPNCSPTRPGREENHLAPARLGREPPALLGTPIPIIHCADCGAQPVPEKDLPVVLPQDLVPDGSGNPLVKSEAFHAGVVCPCCRKTCTARNRHHGHLRRFVLVLHVAIATRTNSENMVADGADYWMPIDQYIGGM